MRELTAQDYRLGPASLKLPVSAGNLAGNVDAVDGFSTKVGGWEPATAGNLNKYDLRKAWKAAGRILHTPMKEVSRAYQRTAELRSRASDALARRTSKPRSD